MKLFAIIIDGKTLGVDVFSYTSQEIGSNVPFIFCKDDESPGIIYDEISSIENWDKYWQESIYFQPPFTPADFSVTNEAIREIYKAIEWSSFSQDEKLIIARRRICEQLEI